MPKEKQSAPAPGSRNTALKPGETIRYERVDRDPDLVRVIVETAKGERFEHIVRTFPRTAEERAEMQERWAREQAAVG